MASSSSQLSCADKGYYDSRLSEYIYPSVYSLWARRETATHRVYLSKPNDTKQLLRRILVDYLAEFCEKNKINTLSRSLAICLFDFFDSSTLLTNMCLSYPFNRDLLCADHAILLMQSCLVVAAKVEDTHYNVPNPTDFRNVTMQDSAVINYLRSCNFPIKQGNQAFDCIVSRLKLPKFPLENYRDMELRILRHFNWLVNIPTVSSFLGAFITELNLQYKQRAVGVYTAQLQAFIKELVTHAEYLAELALQRPELLYSDVPSHLAAACMHGAFIINNNNNWNVAPNIVLVRGITFFRHTIQDLQLLMNSAIARVAPQIALDSTRFLNLVGSVLTSHSENQGEKLPPTPPPDQAEMSPQVGIVNSSPIAPCSQQQMGTSRNCRGLSGKHTRSQHQAQQRLQPYPVSGLVNSSIPSAACGSVNYFFPHQQPMQAASMEQLTPPETPAIQNINSNVTSSGKTVVGSRCVNSGSRQRVVLVLQQQAVQQK